MFFFQSSSTAHQLACARKQKERESQIDKLQAVYSVPLSSSEEKVHALSISELVAQCRAGKIAPAKILTAYGKKTLKAHNATNCITDFMFDEALRTPAISNWDQDVVSDSASLEAGREHLLMGVPVSIKDTIDIVGHDTTIGFSRNAGHPVASSSAIVKLLQDAGALIHVKTAVPAGLLGIETASDLFGTTSNPYNSAFTAGASTGGGGALLACGGSKIEIGTDIGGSVRIPAHFCGIWGLKGSVGRFPSWGNASAQKGLESIQIVASPMAGSLEDLEEFWRRVIVSKPWLYDHTCIPLPWQHVNLQEEGRRLKWGVIWEDGVIPPSPACKRALSTVVAALRKQGHEVVEFTPPNTSQCLSLGLQLLLSDGGQQTRDLLSPSETLSKPVTATLDLLSLPRLFKRFLAYLTRSSDPFMASLLNIMHSKDALEERNLVAQREEYRAAWHDKWTNEGLDFVLSVPVPLPAFEHGGSEKATLMSGNYTFIFNILDYAAGVLPVTFVDKNLDSLPKDFTSSPEYAALNTVAKGAYSVYDAEKMHGLPLGVQVIGRRLEEEKVLEGMKVIEAALREQGTVFVGNPVLTFFLITMFRVIFAGAMAVPPALLT